MVPTTGMRCSMVYCIVACCVFAVTCTALVVTAPTFDRNGILITKEKASVKTKIERLDLDVRIRSTHEGDIREIADILTHALLEEDAERSDAANCNKQQFHTPFNFKFRNIRSGVAPLLESRMNAIKTGRKIFQDHLVKGNLENLSEADQLRLLWSNDHFRNCVETAASFSNEPHIWKEHNYVCAPQSFDWLFHKMITAENAITGEIIGFCEIAMLSQPLGGDSSNSNTHGTGSLFLDEECSILDEVPGIPTIVNLVTSTEYRRRGVGSSVMNSAISYLQKTSSTWNEMALYVEEDNQRAIKMYERLGFKKSRRVESKNQWYMIRQIRSRELKQQSMTKVKNFRSSNNMFWI